MSEVEIFVLAKKYNFRVQVIRDDVVMVESKFDSWIVEFLEGKERPYILKHKNKRHQTDKYHVQHDFLDLPWCFRSIKTHDDDRMYRHCSPSSRIDRLLKNPPKIHIKRSL